MRSLTGKKLLILGGGAATVNVVKQAKQLGLYTIVTGISVRGQAKEIADETLLIGSEEHDKLIDFIWKNHIDGVMTGSSEFQIRNMIELCQKAGLPVYATKEQWDICQDKRHFKDLCTRFGIPGVPEYDVDGYIPSQDFPVIVKPVDSCSSIGIRICRYPYELQEALLFAKQVSPSKRVLVEKYIENEGLTHVIKYAVIDGKFYVEVMGDRYVLNNGLITALTLFPSKNTALYLDTIDGKVAEMFRSIGFANGVFFFQAIPDGDNIYIYEMGLRTGGGMTYKITAEAGGVNDLEMLIRYAIDGRMVENDSSLCIDPFLNGKKAASIAIPLRPGHIMSVSGMESIHSIPGIVNFTHFYDVGDEIMPDYVNTLQQLFGRVMIVRDTEKDLLDSLKLLREIIAVDDSEGNMILWDTFDKVYSDLRKDAQFSLFE